MAETPSLHNGTSAHAPHLTAFAEAAATEQIAIAWVHALRRTHRPRARTLTPSERAQLAPHFSPELLDRVRVRELESLGTIERPDPLRTIESTYTASPIDLDRIRGLTLVDTILLATTKVPDATTHQLTLAAECVHVAQYARLGLEGFLRAYLRGWIAGGFCHERIPLEQQATRLAHAIVTAPHAVGRIPDEVFELEGAGG